PDVADHRPRPDGPQPAEPAEVGVVHVSIAAVHNDPLAPATTAVRDRSPREGSDDRGSLLSLDVDPHVQVPGAGGAEVVAEGVRAGHGAHGERPGPDPARSPRRSREVARLLGGPPRL